MSALQILGAFIGGAFAVGLWGGASFWLAGKLSPAVGLGCCVLGATLAMVGIYTLMRWKP